MLQLRKTAFFCQGTILFFSLHPCVRFPLIPATWSHPLLGIHSHAVKLVAESVQFINLAENIVLFVGGSFARAMFSCVTALNSLTKVLTCAKLARGEHSAGMGCVAGSKEEPPFGDSKPHCIRAVVSFVYSKSSKD